MVEPAGPRELFYSYAHEDEKLRKELDKHLFNLQRQGLIAQWHDRDIKAGAEWQHAIDTHLNAAHVILLLISPDFLASDYCYSIEMQRALERHEAGESCVIPILLKPVDWHGTPFSKLQVLPKNAKPVTRWKDRNEALTEIAKGIRETLKTLPLSPLPNEVSATPSNGATLHSLVDASVPLMSFEEKYTLEPELEPIWHLPYQRNSFFTGREAALQAIRQAFIDQGSGPFQPLILSGMGGIGKTQTAIEYAYRSRDNYKVVLWAKADTLEILISELSSFATLLKLPGGREQDQQYTVDAVKHWLERHREWLLILDNVDDLKKIQSALPGDPQGHLLITARSQITGGIAQRLDIETLSPQDSVSLLLRRAGLLTVNTPPERVSEETQHQASIIAKALDGVPLALDQAGAYIEETGASLQRYLDLYSRQRHDLLSIRGGWGDAHPEPITSTVSLTIEKVAQTSSTAHEFLQLLAFLHPDTISLDLFEQSRSQLSQPLQSLIEHPIEFDQVIHVLLNYSLVRRSRDGAYLTLHRLVQDILKGEMDEPTQRTWAECTIRIVNQAFPQPEVTTWKLCQQLLSQSQHCISFINTWQCHFPESTQLLQKVGAYLHQQGRYTEAIPFITQALAIREQWLETESLEIADSLNELAELLRKQGRYVEAESLYQRALTIREHQLGPDLAEVATSLNNLARAYHHQGRYSEAEPLYQRALTIRDHELGTAHHDVADSLYDLAFLYREQGRYVEAEPLFQRDLAIFEQTLGPNHPHMSTVLGNLATLYLRQGRYVEAEPLYQRALTTAEQGLGPNHPQTAIALSNLATYYTQRRHVTQAEPLFQRALAISEQHLSPTHPTTIKILLGYAILLEMRNRKSQAAKMRARARTK